MADSSLFTSLLGMLDTHSVAGIAGSLGTSEQSVFQGLQSSIASVLGGMASKSQDPGALRGMLDLAPRGAEDTTLSQVAHAASDPNSPLISGGKRLVSGLFGNSETTVVNAVGSASGLRPSTASTILAMAAPMVMGFISKRVRTEGMSMGALGSLLQQESGTIRNALPAGLRDVFWPSTVRTATGSPVAAQAAGREHSTSWRWLPLIALAFLIPFTFWLFNHAHKPAIPEVSHVTAPITPPVTTPAEPAGTANRAANDSIDMVKGALGNNGHVDLRFDTGSGRLRPESEAQLNKIADTLKKYPDVHMTVDGYTDNAGSAAQNIQLSQQRANSVVAELGSKGISADRLTASGHGEDNPIADNSTEAGRATNRRVSVDVSEH